MSEFFDREIFKNLTKCPTPRTPGSLIVTGNSQAIFTGENPGDVVLAGAKYGDGKIIVAAHDCYLNWLHEKSPGVKNSFMKNVKKWLCDYEVDDSEIIDLDHNTLDKFSKYKLVKWHQEVNVSYEVQQKILSYIEAGGALFCGTTPWGYLQIHPDRTLNDMSLHNFLKNFFGIILVSNYLDFPNEETDIALNQAKISNFDLALEKVSYDPNKIKKYMNTIQCGLEVLNKEGVINENKISSIKECVLTHCMLNSLNAVPCHDRPIKNQNEIYAAKLLSKCIQLSADDQAPGIDKFPGVFESWPELKQDIDFSFNTRFSERLSTGYYLPAGINLIIKSISGNYSNWKILIGCHSDDLSNCQELKRWPCITILKDLTPDLVTVSSPFGGLIYLVSPETGGELSLTLSNLVESPFIDLTQERTIKDWNRRKNADGIWGEVAGKRIIFSTPSKCIRNISREKLVQVLEFWDKVVESHHQLRGTNVNDYKRERVVNDMQPSAGYMHSGYPIVTHLDCCEENYNECIFDIEKLQVNGCWGLFHELGHNMQRSEWTFDGSTEVTVNLFSMHANQVLLGQKVIRQKWLFDQRKNYDKFFLNQPTYHDWQHNFFMALITFAQLIKHFGWKPMYNFMRDYENDINYGVNLPKNNQDKIDQWVLRYSRLISRNITPHFRMFGLPVSDTCDNELVNLEPWFLENEKKGETFFND